jgi:hypothetical protein
MQMLEFQLQELSVPEFLKLPTEVFFVVQFLFALLDLWVMVRLPLQLVQLLFLTDLVNCVGKNGLQEKGETPAIPLLTSKGPQKSL